MRHAGTLGITLITIVAVASIDLGCGDAPSTERGRVGPSTTTGDQRAAATPPSTGAVLDATALRAGAAAVMDSYDRASGGFGTGPKSLPPTQLDFLMRWFRRSTDTKTRDAVLATLDVMSRSGVYDHVGGGFHHGATDRAWIVPNFQKTLTDNALMTVAYLDALTFGQNDDFKEVANKALAWIQSMKAPGGGFYSAIGAANDRAYYTWSFAELRKVIDDFTWPFFTGYFPITEAGDVDGMNVLHAPRPMAVVAAEVGRDVPHTTTAVRAQLARLGVIRSKRPAPAIDPSVIVASNGLVLSALARADQKLRGDFYSREAARTAAWMLDTFHRDGRLARSEHEREATLEDYAYLIAGLLDLFEATQDSRWLREALALQDEQDARLHDGHGGGYFRTSANGPDREKPWRDDVAPSGNAVAARNGLRLAALTGDATRRERAEGTLRAFAPLVPQNPTAAPAMLAATEQLLDRPKVIVIVMPNGGDERPLLKQVYATYAPNRTVTVVTEGAPQKELAALVPLVADKKVENELPTAYVCEAGACGFSTTDPTALAREIARVTPLPPS